MKNAVCRVFSLICALAVLMCICSVPVSAAPGEWAGEYAYALNDGILEHGALSAETSDGYFGTDASGVIYADLMDFNGDACPMLVIFRFDAALRLAEADIYNYEMGAARLVTTVSKPVAIDGGHIGELSLGADGQRRYIIYREFFEGEVVDEEHYTVIGSDAFVRVEAPRRNVVSSGVVSFTEAYIHTEVDVSAHNKYLTEFFSSLKDMSAGSVTYSDLADDISPAEKERLLRVLEKTAGFDCFDIGDYSTMSAYSMAVNRHDGEGKLNALTNIYALGDELYYVRYSTDRAFYNGAILRRTDMVTDNYQILSVKNDFIPYSETELSSLKETYLKNRLLLEKSADTIELSSEPIIKVKKLDIEKKLDIPKKLSGEVRIPAAVIGGGACLMLLAALLVYILSDRK